MNHAARRPEPLLPRLPSLLAYPATKAMLGFMAALALFRLLAHAPNILGLLFELAFWVMGYKLAVEALVNTAHGRYEALHGEDLMATDGDGVEQLVLGVLAAVALAATVRWAGLAPALVLMAAIVLFMPAAVMLLSINHSLANALNPLAWFALIGRVGLPYFGVVAVFTVLSIASEALQWVFESALGWAGIVPAGFVSLFALVAGYHMLGDLIHRHAAVLGLDITPAVQRATYANPVEDATMASAAERAGQGDPAAAAELLAGLFRGRGASDPVHEQYRRYLVAAGQLDKLAAHDREYVSSLMVTGKDKAALAVATDTMARVPGFQLDLPDQIARLVALAARQGQSQLAVALARDFEARFPQSPDLPDVALAAARLQSERLGQDAAARDRLRALVQSHPGHPAAVPARQLLTALEQVLGAPGK
ncbi:hypothetical protein [Arenimonas sp.]|uniref:tetratricopeptide repeat protein n=1 Tax=Arenimonas sp. TaxID=1872635 RepID=UPI0025EC5A83|nr:hypothetical protein [Arenimonas sp.]